MSMSMMSPSMVLRDDAVEWILGTGCSKRIRTTLVQVVSALVDHGMQLADAVEVAFFPGLAGGVHQLPEAALQFVDGRLDGLDSPLQPLALPVAAAPI